MKIVSLNVGLPQLVLRDDEPVSTGIFKEPVAGRVNLRTLNLDGDRQAECAAAEPRSLCGEIKAGKLSASAEQNKNPAPQSARGSYKSLEFPSSSLAVFYVEQVA